MMLALCWSHSNAVVVILDSDTTIIVFYSVLSRVSSRILFGGKIVCKDQLCVKHAKFLTSHMPIFEYQLPMHEKT